MKKYLLLLTLPLCFCACGGKQQAEKTGRAFLKAYYTDLDFAKAKQYATLVSHALIDEKAENLSHNPYAKQEAPELTIKELQIDKDNKHQATLTYTLNRAQKTLDLKKVDGKWQADLEKEAKLREEGMQSLEDEVHGGFAAATSGPIKYHKRRTR